LEFVKFSQGDGFGFQRDKDGKLTRNKHNFGVGYDVDVEIGRLTNIDSGSWRDTEIHEGTKIDSLVHIGHNAIIGRHCLLVSGCVIGGSAEIGDYSYIGMNAVIKQHITIGKHVIVGAGAIVIKDVPDKDIVVGNPARTIKNSMARGNQVNLTDEERFRMVGY